MGGLSDNSLPTPAEAGAKAAPAATPAATKEADVPPTVVDNDPPFDVDPPDAAPAKAAPAAAPSGDRAKDILAMIRNRPAATN
jgi:hypothetical protein